MGYPAGKLRHRIDIQKKVQTQSSSGAIVDSWENVYKCVAAAIEPVSVKEMIASQSMQSQITTRITIRYQPGLDGTMRIVHNGRIYNPAGWLPDPDSGLNYVTAPCSEGVNQGN